MFIKRYNNQQINLGFWSNVQALDIISTTVARVKFADGTETSSLGLGTLVVNGYILRGMIMPFELSLISAKELAVEWNLVTCLHSSGGIIFKDQTVFAELRVVGNLYEVIEDKQISLAVRHIRTQKDVVEVHERFGHMNQLELQRYFKNSAVRIVCSSCMAAKMTQKRKVRERDNKYDTIQPLQEISTDTVAAGIKGSGGEQFYCNVCCHATGFLWTL